MPGPGIGAPPVSQFNGIARPPMGHQPGMPPIPTPSAPMTGMPPGQAPGQQFMGASAPGPAQPRRLDPDQMPSPVGEFSLCSNH